MTPAPGWTVTDVARRYRVSRERVRRWITSGILAAVNRQDCPAARPSWVITPEALAAFERERQPATPPKAPPRRKKRTDEIDYFPD
jgi:hypothetical protein